MNQQHEVSAAPERHREKFSSRLGFLLISAGCAIGLGNVYRFPIITGSYGGALFVLIYLAFLLILGVPVMCAELSVGRASQRSIASSFERLEKPGQKWHWMKFLGIGGNYLLMMCYTVIAGWMLIYLCKYLGNTAIDGAGTHFMEIRDAALLKAHFGETVGHVGQVIASTFITIVACFLICSLGLQKGVERVTKYMMLALFVLIIGLGIYCSTLPGAGEGLKFYLIPSRESLKAVNIGDVITAAMGQAFFTLSVGIGSIAIFGSYIGRDRSLLGEAVTITALDTFVALASGFIIFPACFTFAGGIHTDASSVGASFLFTTLSSIFNSMGPVTGRIFGSFFFLFMLFAAYSTVIAVFENIISFWLDLTKLKRWQVCLINIGLLMLLSLPAIFSLGLWENVKLLGMGFLDLEDFIVSNLLLPLGSVCYVLFCTARYGWGWDRFSEEVNTGNGLKFPKKLRVYMTFILPVIILALMVVSLIGKFTA
ncbi:MAG: sodium-dependent transporter [Ruminococcaceae bacterium]|nr:sodium-dependent transporter [Oscillospiraceae bacterium]